MVTIVKKSVIKKCSHYVFKAKRCVLCLRKEIAIKLKNDNEMTQLHDMIVDNLETDNSTIVPERDRELESRLSNEQNEGIDRNEGLNRTDNMVADNSEENVSHNNYHMNESTNIAMNESISCMYCANCKRQKTIHNSSDCRYNNLYDLHINEMIIKKSSLRKKFSTLSISNNVHDIVILSSDTVQVNLCSQCFEYFTGTFKTRTAVYKKVWQIIFWKILSSSTLYEMYGIKLWRILPVQWRKWWITSVRTLLPAEQYSQENLEEIESIIVDVTLQKECLENSINNGILSDIVENCDKYLLPLIKCPWGCTEYYHLSGELSIENIFWKFIAQHEMEEMMSVCDQKQAKSSTTACRNDYLSLHNNVDIENLLWNPQWRIAPSVCFKDSVPVFLTCRNHNKGCNKLYLHPPKNPFSTLPAKVTDQVAQAVVVPRTIRATKACKYSHSYNMQEMRCQFNGIDTISITDKAQFNNDSILSEIYESLAIKGRSDVQSFVAQLSRNNKDQPADLTSSLCDRADEIMKDFPTCEHESNNGSTFLPVKESINLQKEMKKGTTSTISIRKENGTIIHKHYIPKWPIFTYYVHEADTYGSPFPAIPTPSKEHLPNANILWLMSVFHICVQEIWYTTATNVKTANGQWNGWLLLYLTEICFPHLLKKNVRQTTFSWNIFKSKFDKERKILLEMNISNANNHSTEYDLQQETTLNANETSVIEDSLIEVHDEDFNNENNSVFGDDSDYDNTNYDNSNVEDLDLSIETDISGEFSRFNTNNNMPIREDVVTNDTNHENNDVNNDSIDIENMEIQFNVDILNNNDNIENVRQNVEQSGTNTSDTSVPKNIFNTEFMFELFKEEESIFIMNEKKPWIEQNYNENTNIIIFVSPDPVESEIIRNERNDANFVFNIIPIQILASDDWDFRLLCLTSDLSCGDITKWKSEVYCRHNGDMFPGWWHLNSNSVSVKKMKLQFDIVELNENSNDALTVAVFVKRNHIENTMYRDIFLRTIGGQSKFTCKEHNVPLVVTGHNHNELKCCYQEPENVDNGANLIHCKRKKIFASCPIQKCRTSICTFHYKNTLPNVLHPIKLEAANTNNINEPVRRSTMNNLAYTMEEDYKDNYVIEPHHSYEFDFDDSDQSQSTEATTNENELEIIYEENNTEGENNFNQSDKDVNCHLTSNDENNIPCSSSGAGGGLYVSEECKSNFIGCHVILNHCGSLLARRGFKLKATKIQQRFLQSIVATSEGKSIPLLYPEALLFPSIFSKENRKDSCPIGAIPCCLMAHDTTLSYAGFASLIDHFRARITNSSLLTSTNNKYIGFCFDNFLNLQTRHSDTRIILHRGLWNCGLGKNVSPDTNGILYDVDSIQARPIVNKLAAAVAEEQATYFYTHTCNQQEHFGMRAIKKWIDSSDLEDIINKKISKLPHVTQNILRHQEELKMSIIQSAAVSLLRNWMEVSTIWMNYIKNSPEKPLGKITRIWWRHEYQETKGNLSHIHALIWVDKNEAQNITLDRIHGSTLDLIGENDIEDLLQERILHNESDIFKIHDIARTILRHVCNERCKRRTGTGKNDVKCRVTNNGIENPCPTRHFFKEYEILYSTVCTKILKEIGLMTYDVNTKCYETDHAIKAIKHFPPAIGGEGNMSACNGRLFATCLSNENLKFVTSYLASRYLTKYVASIDENNRIYFSSNPNDSKQIEAKMEFLHNTKITSSNINEKKIQDLSRSKLKPQGRAISLMEVITILLGYPQVYTDIKFTHIPSTPLAERCCIEKEAQIKIAFKDKNFRHKKVDDLDPGETLPQYLIRNIKLKNTLPQWRQYTKSESFLMIDQMFSNLTIDNVTGFGLRPPELRFIRHIKMYYRWFYFKASKITSETFGKQVSMYNNCITLDIVNTTWIDGCGRHIYIRVHAIAEVLTYISKRVDIDFYGDQTRNEESETMFEDIDNAKEKIQKLFYVLQECIEKIRQNGVILEREKEIAENFFNIKNFHDLQVFLSEPFPVVWFSSIKPSHGSRWLLHLLISMGEFENEYNLYCKANMKACFVSCKLLSSNYANHENDIKSLTKRYILEQLNYIPGGSKQFDRNVIAAYQNLRNEFLHDIQMSSDIPPVLYTQLQESISEECKTHIENIRRNLLTTTFHKVQGKASIQIPSLDDVLKATKTLPFQWNISNALHRGLTQSPESYDEQMKVLNYMCKCLNIFLSPTSVTTKNIIICGGPGVGKTTLLQLLILYSASLGLNIQLSSVMSERSCELGGIHLSKMFSIPTLRNRNPSTIAEKAVFALLRQPKQLTFLEKLEVLAIDEFGQVSAELLSILDIILRTIRKNSLFMGGILIIATMDHMQLPPVNGRPPLLSPHMLTSFTFKKLLKSVRASQDEKLQELQAITRLEYNKLQPEQINRFRFLIETYCTHVQNFNDPLLTIDKLRLFGKVRAKQLAEETLLREKHEEHLENFIKCTSEDFETTLESHWDVASPTTTTILSRKVKEPRTLCFYPNATYEITFNEEDKFSQGQLALLAFMPTQKQIDDFAPISIYVAPNGCKTFPLSTDYDTLVRQGWQLLSMSKCREHSVYIGNGIEAKRRQYGLRHRIASTIHAGMGQDLKYVVTKVTDTSGDPNYQLWEKEQVIVLLSRTNYAKDIIFVGDKKITSKALSELLLKRSQYTEYTTSMLQTLTSSDETGGNVPTLNLQFYPYRAIDFELPDKSSGFVYLLKSLNPYFQHITYIGETNNIKRRVRQHNQLCGSKSTNNPLLLPWALVAFITGFTSSCSTVRRKIEQMWKNERDNLKTTFNRNLSLEEICNAGKSTVQKFIEEDLRFIQCCSLEITSNI